MPGSSEIRRGFIDYFVERHGHAFVPSSPLPAVGDPSLIFVNSGMVQFKDVFLGAREPADRRVVNSQKCLRVSGKHNDLEDVGRDGTHHTFFEMLGFWSFGDYFKREAIAWLWTLLTDVWGLPKDRLYATVFGGDEQDRVGRDDEAADLWAEVTDIDHSHIQFWGKKDNFWEMAETGPCGPTSEIAIDLTADGSGAALVNGDDPRVVELGNIVFMQYDRAADGTLTPLPHRHIDFGGGFERLAAVMNGSMSNYDTDLFTPIFDALKEIAGVAPYGGRWDHAADIAYRVIADHARCLTFAITDGVLPSNDGGGYVLRRILRRAARHGLQSLGVDEPFLHRLVPVLVDVMGGAFPELGRDPNGVATIIREEERGFQRTLGRGIEHFEKAAAGRAEIAAEDTFRLSDTYGFPLDLTQLMAAERGLTVDVEGYERLMAGARELSRSAAKDVAREEIRVDVPATEFLGYQALEAEADVLAIVRGPETVPAASEGEEVRIVLSRTPFYAEGGGQVGDRGAIRGPAGAADVLDTRAHGGVHLHRVRVTSGELRVGDAVHAAVSPEHRAGVEPSHTATHMLHHTLRASLGDHVRQMGSLVEPGRLHFDFSHFTAVPRDALDEMEETVNARVASDDAVRWFETGFKEATEQLGALAFFEDKYGDTVRVVQVGDYSLELCGGTHVAATGRVGFVKVLREGSIGSNIRRVEALVGREGLRWVNRRLHAMERAAEAARVSPDDLVAGVERLQRAHKDLQKQLERRQSAQAGAAVDELIGAARDLGGVRLVVARRSEDMQALGELAVKLRDKLQRAVVVLGSATDGKAALVGAATKTLGVDAREILKAAAPLIGGGAGGKPELARAGGAKPEGLDAALAAATAEAERLLT